MSEREETVPRRIPWAMLRLYALRFLSMTQGVLATVVAAHTPDALGMLVPILFAALFFTLAVSLKEGDA